MGGAPTLIFRASRALTWPGRVVGVGFSVDSSRIGERGLLDFNLYAEGGPGHQSDPDLLRPMALTVAMPEEKKYISPVPADQVFTPLRIPTFE